MSKHQALSSVQLQRRSIEEAFLVQSPNQVIDPSLSGFAHRKIAPSANNRGLRILTRSASECLLQSLTTLTVQTVHIDAKTATKCEPWMIALINFPTTTINNGFGILARSASECLPQRFTALEVPTGNIDLRVASKHEPQRQKQIKKFLLTH